MSNSDLRPSARPAPPQGRDNTRNDDLSEVLRAVRVTAAVIFEGEASAPWPGQMPGARPTPALRSLVPEAGPLTGADQLIEYALITAGRCCVSFTDDPPIQLSAGDVVAFPQGNAVLRASAVSARRPLAEDDDEGGRTLLVRGLLRCDARALRPLLGTLPLLIHVAASDGVIEQLIRLTLAESRSRRAGSDCVLTRLSELTFVELVRHHWSTLASGSARWLGGLRNDSLGRVLGRLHERPAHGWTLNQLAREAGMSRSVLAERFSQLVGIPPMQYLTEQRMQLTAQLLSDTSLNLAEIAERVGYGSEAALSRAYKRSVGVPPAEWRRRRRFSHGPRTPGHSQSV